MSNSDIHFVHSGDIINKDPDFDLGGLNSKFDLAIAPFNNLFNDVPLGTIDYRCFYIFNKHIDMTVKNCMVTIDDASGGATITFGSKIVDDVQKLVFMGTPDLFGYAIFETEFGPPFTVTYDDAIGGWATFAANFEAQIQQQPFCSTVDVQWIALSSVTNILTVTFQGEAGHRKTKLIKVIQNNLVNKEAPPDDYDVAPYISGGVGGVFIDDGGSGYTSPPEVSFVPLDGKGSGATGTATVFAGAVTGVIITNSGNGYTTAPSVGFIGEGEGASGVATLFHDPFNAKSESKIKVTRPINTEYVPPDGIIAVYNPSDNFGTWERLSYTSYSSDIFNMAVPLLFDLIRGPDIEVIGLEDHQVLIQVTKKTDGSPINSMAVPIDSSFDTPDFTEETSFSVGTLRPQEGFFLWIKRDANPVPPKPFLKDSFSLTFTGLAVSFPP
jgi:hypothetical protein